MIRGILVLTALAGLGTWACGGTEETLDAAGSGGDALGGAASGGGSTGGRAASGGAEASGGTSASGGAAEGGSSLGGAKGEPVVVDSGVDPDKQVDELSGEEIAELCTATVDAVEQSIDFTEVFCRYAGLTAATSAGESLGLAGARQACQLVYAACLDDPDLFLAQAGASNFTLDASTCEGRPDAIANCDVTVAEYEACATDSVAAADRAERELPTCKSLTEEQLAAGPEATVSLDELTPPSCVKLQMAGCEGF